MISNVVRRYGCGLILLLSFGLVRAQLTHAKAISSKYNFRNIDNSNGLNSNDVFALTQDRKGYIWIGTEKGLQRYDGLRFMDCFTDRGKIGSKSVYSLYPDDANGRILFDQPDRRLRHWDFLTNASVDATPESPAPAASDTCEDWNKKSWIVKEYWQDSAKLPSDLKGIALVKEPGSNHYRHAYFIRDMLRRQIWLIDSAYGLVILDQPNQTAHTSGPNFGSNQLLSALKEISPTIHKIVCDRHGNIWLISWSRFFYRFDRRTQVLTTYSLPSILKQEANLSTLPCWVSDILVDDHGALWLTTAKAGLLQYDYVTDGFLYMLRQPGNNIGLQYSHQINAIFQDREENIWLGTDRGICIFNPYRQYFSTLSNQDTGKLSAAINEISTAALIGNQELWVGSWGGGISVYDLAFHFKRHIFFKGQIDQNEIWSIIAQDDGTVWAGCQAGLLHIIDRAGRVIRTIQPVQTEGRTIKDMVHDKDGNTLIGLHNGKIILFSKKEGRFLAYNKTAQPNAVHLSPVESLYAGEDGSCYAGTWDGLGEYDIQKRCFVAIHHPFPGSNVRCYGISRCNDSMLVVGTENYGLYFFNRHTHRFSRVPVSDDRANWSAYAVDKDSAGKIWFSTDYSIGNYDPLRNKGFICQPEQGLINTAFAGSHFLHSPAGNWITWTSAEMVAFQTDQIAGLSDKSKPVTITGFSVFSNPLFIDSLISRRQPVALSYNQNFIGIEFSNLQFSNIEKPKYYYRLDEVDPEWVDGGTRGSASYTNLPPGNYTFRVRTDGGDGKADVAILPIHIAAPYWASWWFRASVVILIGTILFGLMLWHNRGVRRESSLKEQIATTEMMALRAQMNPHFIFNCINSIDALIQSNDKYNATVYLNKFAQLIRNILDTSKQKTISLARDLETLQLYIDMELFRSEDKFAAEIRVADGLLDDELQVPPLIIQPYVENAILHGLWPRQGSEGKLLVSVVAEGECLVFVIEDNGVGRSAANGKSRRRSYGMDIGRDRVNLFNREEHIPVTITDLLENGIPAGTRVQVSLKLRQ
jgi:ligand-binding sensor domain-containing protein